MDAENSLLSSIYTDQAGDPRRARHEYGTHKIPCPIAVNKYGLGPYVTSDYCRYVTDV